MSISNAISRVAEYYRRHGLMAMVSRAGLQAKRALFKSRMAVFYYDLNQQTMPKASIPDALKVQRVRGLNELGAENLQAITSFWNPKLAGLKIRERFEKGASLWLLENEGQLAGYSWTIKGRAIETYYFPLGNDDVQLFDFYVFPKFRGRAVLWFLIAEILQALNVEGAARVFGDVAEWNQPSLSFYKMTPFRLLGLVTTYRIFGQVLTRWSSSMPTELAEKGITRRSRAMKVVGSNK